MTSALLTVWLRPGTTLDAVLKNDGATRWTLPLAALTGVALILGEIAADGGAASIADPAALAALAAIGAVTGIINLLLISLGLHWTARLVGGQAAARNVRIAVAWGGVPVIAGLPPLLLLAMTAASGAPLSLLFLTAAMAIWSWCIIFAMVRRLQGFGFWRTAVNCVLAVALFALLPVHLFRAFVYEPFSVASASMEPGLLKGDSMIVAKYAYGFSRYSLPGNAGLIPGRLFARLPQRGDIVVFKLPSDPKKTYVKRLVGLPGDHIRVEHRVLIVNGQPVRRDRIDEEAPRSPQFRETLPEGRDYLIQESSAVIETPADNTDEFVVPDGDGFMMGDNRENSLDSRYLSQIGYVPLEMVIGRVALITYSVDEHGGLLWNRVGLRPR